MFFNYSAVSSYDRQDRHKIKAEYRGYLMILILVFIHYSGLKYEKRVRNILATIKVYTEFPFTIQSYYPFAQPYQ